MNQKRISVLVDKQTCTALQGEAAAMRLKFSEIVRERLEYCHPGYPHLRYAAVSLLNAIIADADADPARIPENTLSASIRLSQLAEIDAGHPSPETAFFRLLT